MSGAKINRHSGYVALIGRTNVGKSTFLNAILQSKISIVSSNPQTTRKRILGIKTTKNGQAIFFDSPGVHKPLFRMNERMMKEVYQALTDADLILYLVEIDDQGRDEFLVSILQKTKKPIFLLINKIDKYRKTMILEKIELYRANPLWQEIIPISAKNSDNLETVENLIYRYLPEGEDFFDEEHSTRQSEKYYISELIREKVLAQIHDELPFTTSVRVEEIKKKEKIIEIHSEILVETLSQKKIIIGKKGTMIKKIGENSRRELEIYYNHHVFLNLYVKIVPNWRNSTQIIKEMFE